RVSENLTEAHLWVCHPENDTAVLLDTAHSHRTHAFLEDELERAIRHQPFVGEDPRGADGRMARELQLAKWREDAHLRRMRAIFGRQDKRRLREVHLTRDALHRFGPEVMTIQHDRKLVARKWLLGEDVDDPDPIGPPHLWGGGA